MKGEYRKWGMYAGIILAIFIISFVVGFLLSREREEVVVQTPVKIIELPESHLEEKPQIPVVSYYRISADGEKLRLHYIEGEMEVEIKSEEFSKEVFPEEDILELYKGIKTQTSEEAFSVWENFIS